MEEFIIGLMACDATQKIGIASMIIVGLYVQAKIWIEVFKGDDDV